MKVLLCLFAFFATVAFGRHCKGTNPDTGITYDFSKLVVDTGYMVQFKQGPDVYDMIVNPCNQVGGLAMCTDDCSVCQQEDRSTAHWCCGSADKHDMKWSDLGAQYQGMEGIVLEVSGGENGRNSNITFLCDDSAGAGSPMCQLENRATRTYVFEWRTKYACGGDSKQDLVNLI